MALPDISTILTFAGFWIGGLFAVWSLIDQKLKARSKERDEQEARIIELYKSEVAVLKDKVESYDQDFKKLRREFDKMSGQNSLMRDLLTGKDKETVAWRARTEDAMKLTKQIGQSVLQNGKKTDAVLKSVERLATAIEKHLQNQEK